MNTYNKQQLNEMTVATLLKMAKQAIHPDKVEPQHVAQATELFKQLKGMNKAKLIELLVAFFNNVLFDAEPESDNDIIDALASMKAAGKSRKQGKGWLLFEHDIDGKHATELLDNVWSRSSGANKADIVAHIIACQNAGDSNADIAQALCDKFGWAPSTGKTVISHLSYMIEYARQING